MPRIIAQNRIPRVPIASRSIAIGQTVGGVTPATAGVGVGGGVWAAAAPDARFVSADALFESSIVRARQTGALPAVPQVGRYAAPSSMYWYTGGQNGNYAFSNNRRFWAAGGGHFYWSPSGPFASSALTVGASWAHFNVKNSISGLWNTAAGLSGAAAGQIPYGMSYANGEAHNLTSDGLWSWAPVLYGNPTPVKYGSGAVGGSSSYTQLVNIAGRYVIWASLAVPTVPRYATDRATWTNCTVPTLNGDGGGAGNGIVWIYYDPWAVRLVAVTQYGEILVCTDGITFTKTAARTAGLVSFTMETCWVSPSGKVYACGTSAGAGQVFVAADVGSPWVAQTVTLGGGKTILTRAYDVNGTAGVTALLFRATTATPTSASIVVSVDDGATWLFGTGGDGTMSGQNVDNGQNVLLATEGVFASVSGLTTGAFGSGFGDRIVTDADALNTFWQTDPVFIDLADGVTKKRFWRVS
jgi:hypothetical protein